MIYIKGNFPSFKNSKQFTRSGFVVMSKTVRKFLKTHEHQFDNEDIRNTFLEELESRSKPYMIGVHFVRGTRHRYDWINMCQGIQDLMVKHGWIEDDNTDIMFPVPMEVGGLYSSYDKENPGTWIKIHGGINEHETNKKVN